MKHHWIRDFVISFNTESFSDDLLSVTRLDFYPHGHRHLFFFNFKQYIRTGAPLIDKTQCSAKIYFKIQFRYNSDINQNVLDKGLDFTPTPKTLLKSSLWKQPPILDVVLKLHTISGNRNVATDLTKSPKNQFGNKSIASDILETNQNINTELTNLVVHMHHLDIWTIFAFCGTM